MQKKKLLLIPGSPLWWHVRGTLIETKEIKPSFITMNSVAVRITIEQIEIAKQKAGKSWLFIWKIRRGPNEYTSGQLEMTTEELESAFGLNNILESNLPKVLKELLPDSCISGTFIRKGQFLNVPGTGLDGDPNLSVYISDEIKISVEALIKRNE